MSRRRPTDVDAALTGNSLPPPASADLGNGKRRSPTERFSRFIRTRPVSSLLLLIVFITTTFVGFKIFHTLGTTIHGALKTKSETSTHTTSKVEGAKTLRDLHDHETDDDSPLHEVRLGDMGNVNLHVADDEKGALVDGADDTEGLPVVPDVAVGGTKEENRSEEKPRVCHRKFEPGKLGSDKMLCVTDEFFFDISIGKKPVGTLKIGVFGDVVPKSAANFRALATCSGVFADENLCYRGDSFHRIVTNFVAQGGSKATGKSIFGPTFREEKEKDHHSFLTHGEKGVVSWAEYPIGSQFFILIRDEATYLDGNHVVFGIVTEGMDVLDKIHDVEKTEEQPKSRVTITDCGDAHK